MHENIIDIVVCSSRRLAYLNLQIKSLSSERSNQENHWIHLERQYQLVYLLLIKPAYHYLERNEIKSSCKI